MRNLVLLYEKQFLYTKNVFISRKDHFAESMNSSLFPDEPTAGEVFIHGINPLLQLCHEIVKPDANESVIKLKYDRNMNRPEHFIDPYENTLQLLNQIQLKLTEEDLNKPIAFSSSSRTKKSLRDCLCLNLMHTITHIGQALRLQALYLRNMT